MSIKPWYIQAPITLVPFLVLSVAFPIIGWICVLSVFRGIEIVTGYRAPLVGTPDGIAPGAVIVTVLYFFLCAFMAKILIQNQLFIGASIVGVGALLFLPYNFSIVSSMIWF